MTSITIPNSVTDIGNYAFSSCAGLTSITIPDSVTSIGNGAFQYCTSLTSMTIPDSVTSIGKYAFKKCTSLTSMTIGNSVTSIGDYAFEYCSSLVSIIVKNGNTIFDSRNNCNAIIETSTNIIVFGCKNTAIPNSVVSIGNMAFANCDSLTTITIPNSVTSIGESAFNAAGLTSITIPNSVTSIGKYAFSSCAGLTSITIPDSVTSIGVSAFGDISAKLSFTKLYSTYTNKIFSTPINNTTTYTYNVEFNISEIPTNYNISSMLPQPGNKGTITYNIYTDYVPCKDQALALANSKTIVNVYHIDGTSWT